MSSQGTAPTAPHEAQTQPAPAPKAAPSAEAEPAPPPRERDTLRAGQEVQLRASHKSGVPLHPAPASGAVSGRLVDGSRARIEAMHEGGRWLEVSQGATRGFITRRYVVVPEGASAEGRGGRLSSSSVFASREGCQQALARGERSGRGPSVARIGSWNLRWFPDGKPGKGERTASAGSGSDIEWLACVIRYLELDALALQEVKATPAARAKLTELARLLTGDGNSSWVYELDGCPEQGAQHVGFLYDSARLTRLGSGTLGVLNPHGAACKDQLRPGFGLFARLPGGLDLHLVSVHFKAGGEERSFELRKRSFLALSEALAAAQSLGKDQDVLVLGDLNTMGCPECSPALSGREELSSLDSALADEGFRRVAADATCSHYYGNHGSLLDGALASRGLTELEHTTKLRVSGLCGELSCSPLTGKPAAVRRLSDHCPVFIDVQDQDRD